MPYENWDKTFWWMLNCDDVWWYPGDIRYQGIINHDKEAFFSFLFNNFDGLAQDCSNSSALAMELPQSCTKPSIYSCK